MERNTLLMPAAGMDRSQKHESQLKKPYFKDYMLFNPTFKKFKKRHIMVPKSRSLQPEWALGVDYKEAKIWEFLSWHSG